MTFVEKNSGVWRRLSRIPKRARVLLVILLVILLPLLLGLLDNRLVLTTYTVSSDKITKPLRLVMLSDLHGMEYGDGQEDLLRMVGTADPDAVLLVGDICDRWDTRETAGDLLQGISEKYPCFYVTGNHEYWTGRSEDILMYLASYDITILEGVSVTLEINGQEVNICGITDADAPWYSKQKLTSNEQLDHLATTTANGNFSLLLAHRPELFEIYSTYEYDLVLSGHAHGGQWRVPGLINGVAAPNQGLFPRFAGGWYEKADTVMIVGRGLANNAGMIPRIFNPPEVVVIEVVPEE